MRLALTSLKRAWSKRELVAWAVVIIQGIALVSLWNNDNFSSHTTSIDDEGRTVPNASMTPENANILTMNDRPYQYYEERKLHANDTSSNMRQAYYEYPSVHHKDAGLVNRVWRSNSSPSIHSDLKKGSCWCSADKWCMCTPSLAVDVILTSGPNHIWLVRREDTGQLALMVRLPCISRR